ncbi:hypothetical protein ACHQM5_023579 [Ranunculus cassubicifolius]
MRFWRKIKTLHRVGKLIEHINKRSAEISTYRSRFNIDISVPAEDPGTETLQSRRRTTFIIEEPVIVGFHEDASQLANWLIEQEQEPRRRVMSIIGMGGLGKTTLAKLIYGRKDVEDHFDLRAWTCVSQEYETRDLLLSTLKQVKGVIPDYELSRLEEMNEGELKIELHEYLNGKRYLVVIDDMWQAEAWKGICEGFPENHNSSRVVITTRNMEVATGADPLSEHHKLRLLNEEESWELLCKKVFPKGSCPPALVGVGKEIVEKCGGLPLAIVVLGGLLIRKRKTHDAWWKVLASANWQLSQDSNPCYEIIALSYADLPYYLKSCFLYLGLYPEDFEINVKKLTLLWIAEGFVQSKVDVEVEDVAEDYFVELTQRSLIQVSQRRYEGGPVETCRVHDLLRDLAISKARDYKFMDYYGRNNDVSNSGSRRISIHSGITRADGIDFSHFTPNLRTLLFFGRRTDMNMWFQDGIKMLRVLDLKSVDLWCHMPEDIGELVFLQYLGFDTKTNTFPTSICDLPKLQTLDFRGAYISPCLPSNIWKMKQLRHLYFEMYCWYGVEDFNSVDTETLPSNLLTLEISSDIWAKLGEKGLSKAFVEFDHLRSLTLRGELETENLKYCFPSSLTVLNLEGCLLETDPSDVLGNLTNLEELRICIASYMGKRMSFSDKGFSQLKFLQLQELPLEEWVVQDGAMPQLKHLMIGECQSLRMLPDGLRYITNLQKLELSLMPKKFRNRVKENGQDWDKIQNVPFIVGT